MTSSWGGLRYEPYAFTEQGAAMLSSVLNSKRAIEVNIQIIRTFAKLRELLSTNESLQRKITQTEQNYDKKLKKSGVAQVFLVSCSRNYWNYCSFCYWWMGSQPKRNNNNHNLANFNFIKKVTSAKLKKLLIFLPFITDCNLYTV